MEQDKKCCKTKSRSSRAIQIDRDLATCRTNASPRRNCLVEQGINTCVTLGPLLFLIYINDMPNCLEKANIRTFADDTTLFYSSNSLQDLEKTINEEFNHLLSYCSANKLSVNFKKTHYVTISPPLPSKKKQITLSLIYTILKKRTTSNT